MRVFRILAVAASALALAGTALLTSPVSAFSLPAIDAHATGWYTASVRPGLISVGQGGSPEVGSLRYSTWNSTGAWASGTLELFWCTGIPLSQCVPTKYAVKVTIYQPISYGGQQWFSRMTWRYHTKSGVPKTRRWSLTSGGFWYQTSITTG